MNIFEQGRSMPIERERQRESLSDAALGGLLAAVGNHEGKALLLASMQPEIVYSQGGLNNLTKVSGEKVWSQGIAFNWCAKSLAPIGLVARELIDPEKGIVGYEVTEKGREVGVALAGHLLAFSERHPEVSLGKLFGATHSPRKARELAYQDEGNEERNRAPLTRHRIFTELVTGDQPIRQEDLITLLCNDYPSDYLNKQSFQIAVSHHLDRLVKAGVITYKSIVMDSSFIAYARAKDMLAHEPPSYKRQTSLTQQINTIISQAERALTRQEIYTILLKSHPHYAELNEGNLKDRISKVSQHLVREGFVSQEGDFDRNKQSELSLSETQYSTLLELVELVEKFREQDPVFLAEGQQKAREISSDPVRFRALMYKAKENSSNANSRSQVDTLGEIVAFLQAHPGGTNRDIQKHLEEGGRSYSLTRISAFTRSLTKDGRLTAEKKGHEMKYSGVEQDDRHDEQEIVIFERGYR